MFLRAAKNDGSEAHENAEHRTHKGNDCDAGLRIHMDVSIGMC